MYIVPISERLLIAMHTCALWLSIIMLICSGVAAEISGFCFESDPTDQFYIPTDGQKDNAFRVVVIGDSIAWGEGLLDTDKYSYQLATWLNETLGRTVEVTVYAHNGAKINSYANDDYCREGECGSESPSLSDQIDFIEKPERVDLVLVSGGINDVGIFSIMDSDIPKSKLEDDTAKIEEAMRKLINSILNKCSNANIIVTGYYQIVSYKTDDKWIPMKSPIYWLNGPTYFKDVYPILYQIMHDGKTLTDDYDTYKNKLIDNSFLFQVQSDDYLEQAVGNCSDMSRVLFVPVNFQADNALGAPNTFLWGFPQVELVKARLEMWSGQEVTAIKTEDPKYKYRVDTCRIYHGENDRDVLIDDVAALAHPNVKGASRYYQFIKKNISQNWADWLKSHGNIASATDAKAAVTSGTLSYAPAEEWNRTFGGTNEDYAYSVQQISDGGYILAGTTSSFGAGGSDAWLIKTDSNGRELWSRTFGGTNSDQAESIHLTSDGGCILAGSTASFSSDGGGTNPYGTDPYKVNSDVWLIKTDSKGNMVWSKTFGGLNVDLAHSVQPTPDGGYIIAGETQSLSYWGKDALQALKHMQAEGSSWPTPIHIHPWDRRRFIDSDAWLIKTDANGNELWNRTFGRDTESWCTGCADDSANSVQLTSDGGYILAGDTWGGTPWLIKVNGNGDEVWNRTFDEMGYDYFYANSVQPTPDGGYILAGGKYNTSAWLIKTDMNGKKIWNKTFNNKLALSFQCTSDGGYILAGTVLIKVDANGNEIWSKTFDGSMNWINSVQTTSEGGYILAGVTLSRNAENWWDAWLIKVAPG